MPYGQAWRNQRKIYQAILSITAVRSLTPLQEAEATLTLYQLSQTPELYYDHIRRYSTAVILSSVFGIRGPEFDHRNITRLYHAQDQFTGILETGATPPVDIFPFLKRLPDFMSPWRRWARQIRAEQRQLYFELLQEVKSQRARGIYRNCFMSQLLDEKFAEKYELDEEHIAYIGGVLMEGGSDTTASTLLSFLLAMTKYPKVFQKAQEEVDLRGGTEIRVDIYRPKTEKKVPAIIMWGPYGKSGNGMLNLKSFPSRAGVPKAKLSGYECFEGLDPAEWVPRGYAVVNIDPPGINDSEGDFYWWGTQDGRDGRDAIEEIAQLPWCTGRVSLAGNSWLAMSQWFIAAERPPHLTCIAPLEGASDVVREDLFRGGIWSLGFMSTIQSTLRGRNNQEDVVATFAKSETSNEYWEDKRARLDKIEVPTYILGSYSTGLHTLGAVRAFEEIKHNQKWLTIHDTQEWYDLYSDQRIQDLDKFFSKYLKGDDNGWEQTAPITAPDHNDLDVYALIRKADKDGNLLMNNNIPLPALGVSTSSEVPPIKPLRYIGPQGMLRASRRDVCDALSTPYWKTLSNAKVEPVAPGTVLQLENYIWPTGIVFQPGEQLVLQISGHDMTLAELVPLIDSFRNENKGTHIVHLGGQFESYLDIHTL
ncbi:hypothetical protein ATERTT37_005457 [Aspergillus terreus]